MAQEEPTLPLAVPNSPVTNADGERVGTLKNITIERLRFNTNNRGKLVVTGVLDGTLVRPGEANRQINDLAFSGIPARMTAERGDRAAVAELVCQILNLDIGRIDLNLLGLRVNLAPVDLDITAVTGRGNLLGNLLCALVGLLD